MLHLSSFYLSQMVEDDVALHDALKGLSKKEQVDCVMKAGIDSVKKLKTFSVSELILLAGFADSDTKKALGECFARLNKVAPEKVKPEDDDLPTIKARTMYKMVEDVDESKSGVKKLLFLSSKQANLIARDPSAIDKMLAIFLDKQQPRMVINLLPSMIRCWTRVRPLPGDPDGEREGLAALDRFMAEHIIPLAEKTHAIILCSAVQPFCVLSESLSRMLKLVRSRWGSKLPFTILSCTGVLPALYTVTREGTTWRQIRNLSRVWKKREEEVPFADAVQAKINKNKEKDSPMNQDFDMDLDPNGTNFIIVDPTSSSAKYDSYNGLITEIVRKLAAEFPSIAIQTGKSKFSNLAETNASGIEVALSNMEAGTPVLLLDLTKRNLMPARLSVPVKSEPGGTIPGGMCKEWWARWVRAPPSKPTAAVTPKKEDDRPATSDPTTAAVPKEKDARPVASDPKPAAAPKDGDAGLTAREPTAVVTPENGNAGPATRRRQQIEWHRAQIEDEERRRFDKHLPDYDWDVCMLSHFHDGARRSHCTHRTLTTSHTLLTHAGRRSALRRRQLPVL